MRGIRENWVEAKFEDLLRYIQPTNYIVKSTKYNDTFNTPVLTPGKSFIKGYTNEMDGIFKDIPTIIFDDFTTASRYVDFQFKVKSSAMKILKPTSKLVNLKYVFNVMQITNVRSDTHKRYWISIFAKEKILLPPLPEQRAIVAKIEQCFSELDKGIASFKTAQKKLEIYRQAVLKKAFEGELTQTWREQQSDLPTAEELLQRIQQERQQHYQQQISDWEKAVKDWEMGGKDGRKPAKPRKQKELDSLTNEELGNLSKLPPTMVWTQLGCVVWSVKDGPHYSPKYSDSGIPFISGGNIRANRIDFSNTKFISLELHKELSIRCKPKVGDVLYTKGGTTGIACVNTYDIDFNVWVHVAVLKTIEMINPFYLQHVLNSTHCYKQSQKYTHGVGNQDLGLTRMILITLPLCSLQEQTQIVQEIESRLSVCDKLADTLKQQLEKAEALRQSILKKAFEGRLLTDAEIQACQQEADWEPAEQLLARIKAESAAKTAAKPRKKQARNRAK